MQALGYPASKTVLCDDDDVTQLSKRLEICTSRVHHCSKFCSFRTFNIYDTNFFVSVFFSTGNEEYVCMYDVHQKKQEALAYPDLYCYTCMMSPVKVPTNMNSSLSSIICHIKPKFFQHVHRHCLDCKLMNDLYFPWHCQKIALFTRLGVCEEEEEEEVSHRNEMFTRDSASMTFIIMQSTPHKATKRERFLNIGMEPNTLP